MALTHDDVTRFTDYGVTARDSQQVTHNMLKMNMDAVKNISDDTPCNCFRCFREVSRKLALMCPVQERAVSRWCVYDGILNFCCFECLYDYLLTMQEKEPLCREYTNSLGLTQQIFARSYPNEKLVRAMSREVLPVLPGFQNRESFHPRVHLPYTAFLPCSVRYQKRGDRYVSMGLVEDLSVNEDLDGNLLVTTPWATLTVRPDPNGNLFGITP